MDEVVNAMGDNRPTCSQEDVDTLNARAEANLRNRALTLSAICVYILLAAHIVFAYIGKAIIFPDIIWAIVLSPWFGVAGGRISGIIEDLLSKEKK